METTQLVQGVFQAGLDMIEQMTAPDPRDHASLLLRLGDTLRKINDYAAAKARLRAAARRPAAGAVTPARGRSPGC